MALKNLNYKDSLEGLWTKCRVEFSPNKPCRLWQGCPDNKGYGEVRMPPGTLGVKTGVVRVHRLAYWLAYGDFPLEMQVDHICRNKSCCEPTHLRLVTRESHGSESRAYAMKPASETIEW